MSSIDQDILEALKERLESIKVSNGYPLTVKKVNLDVSEIQTTVQRTPHIDVMQGDEDYSVHSGGRMDILTEYIIRYAMPKNTSDAEMAEFKRSIALSIFNNSYSGIPKNAGIQLIRNGRATIICPKPVVTVSDANCFDMNRIWYSVFQFHRVSNTSNW
jgi:hypothetical protein